MLNSAELDRPVFIFSAGWRAGSTMLQRLLTASGEVLVWGESGGAINSMNDAMQRYVQMLGPGGSRYRHGFGGNGEEQYRRFSANVSSGTHYWIASMNPGLNTIEDGFRSFFHEVYARPAADMGFDRWGVKEVQLDMDCALFLKKLYPNARFIFMIRNPVSCLLSIKRRDWMDQKGNSGALQFYANNWLRLASEFRQANFGMLVYYEQLLQDRKLLERMSDYLELSRIPEDFIDTSHADWKPGNSGRLSWLERKRIHAILGKEMALHGYSD